MVWWFHGRQLVALRIPEVTRTGHPRAWPSPFFNRMNQLICITYAGVLEDDQVERCSGVLSMVH
eukprot:scaffold612_cov79-Skeletonema_marinoi.AAC.1